MDIDNIQLETIELLVFIEDYDYIKPHTISNGKKKKEICLFVCFKTQPHFQCSRGSVIDVFVARARFKARQTSLVVLLLFGRHIFCSVCSEYFFFIINSEPFLSHEIWACTIYLITTNYSLVKQPVRSITSVVMLPRLWLLLLNLLLLLLMMMMMIRMIMMMMMMLCLLMMLLLMMVGMGMIIQLMMIVI